MRARLTLETGTATPVFYDLRGESTITLGRSPKSSLVLEDRFASRHHAEVFAEGQRWHFRDLSPTNPSRLNGRSLPGPTPLADGDVIAIGDVRLRFSLIPCHDSTDELPALQVPPPPARERESDEPVVVPAGSATRVTDGTPSAADLTTDMQANDLTTLVAFMTESLAETTVHGLVGLALASLHRQTRAALAGYLSLDAEDGHLKIVHPADACVDAHLSRRLTQAVVRQGRTVWLDAGPTDALESDSLLAFRDALGLPLRADPAGADAPLGALHVYRTSRPFTSREVHFCEVLSGCLARMLHALRARRALEADNSRLRGHTTGDADLIGDSPALRQLRKHIQRLADLPCNVLVTGESGVGKELVAVNLHRRSRRRDGPFVPVNCAALPHDLIESELFGHAEDAYTGSKSTRQGFFLAADEGTLFLDEIGDMPLGAQAKLLRAIETKRIRAVGQDREQSVDVRIVAATNRDLGEAVRERRFRPDLLYRLGTTIAVPPLREHAEDVPALVRHILGRLAVEYRRKVTLTETALERLQGYHWAGNVRQLRNVLETALTQKDDGDTVHAGDLHLPDEPGGALLESLNLEEVEARTIRQALARTEGNNSQAAKLLGIHRDTLLAKLKKYGIERRGGGDAEGKR